MNVNEWGVVFRLNTNYDMSGNTALSLTFTKPNGTTLTVTPTAPAVAASGFDANEYFQYTFVDGDVDQDGPWSVRGTYTDANKVLLTPSVAFTVDP